MEIKGVYNEKTYKEEKNKKYAPDVNLSHFTTAGQYLQGGKEGEAPRYAFKPKKTPEQVKQKFLIDLKVMAQKEFYNSAEKTIKVIRQYFPVYYIDLRSIKESHLTSTRHYKPSGEYSIDGKLEGDTLKVDISQGSTYSHTSYDIETTRKSVDRREYYSTITGTAWVGNFAEKFYETDSTDESMLISAEEIMQDTMFDWYKPSYFVGSDSSYELLQILLFPIWRVECDFNGHTYVNYVSDVADSKILYLELSSAGKNILEEKKLEEQKIKAEKERLKHKEKLMDNISFYLCMVAGFFLLISVLVHLFSTASNPVKNGDGYCGFLIAHLSTLGKLLTTFLGGFSLIASIPYIIGFKTLNKKAACVFNILTILIVIVDLVLYITSLVKLS